MSNCETCGSKVKVVGNTTKHYEPDTDDEDRYRGLYEDYSQEVEELQHERKAMEARIARLEEALDGILSNVALDWYVAQFAKPESPSIGASGIVARIHNKETVERAARAFEQARDALNGRDEKGKGV